MTVDGYDKPIDLVASMTIGPTGIDVDFTGTSGVSAFGINVPLCYTEAYTSFGVKCIVAPKVPNNEGSLAVIRVTAPDGCILNAKHPLAGRRRATSSARCCPTSMFGCLHQALPGGVPAEGTSCLWNLSAIGGPGRVDGDPADTVERHRLQRHELPFRRHRRAARAATACRPPPSRAACATCRSRSTRRSRRW